MDKEGTQIKGIKNLEFLQDVSFLMWSFIYLAALEINLLCIGLLWEGGPIVNFSRALSGFNF